MEEAYRFCVFLSEISHQYIYPTNYFISAANELEPCKLHVQSRQPPTREGTFAGHTLVLPDQNPQQFCETVQKWYATNDEYLRSRYLYRYSLQQPYTFSPDRFLAIFQAVEGMVPASRSQLLTAKELDIAAAAIRKALPEPARAELVLNKIRNNNTESPASMLKRELPLLFGNANIRADFNVNTFVDRNYKRRNKASHSGSHLEDRELSATLMDDTFLLTAIFVIVESHYLGLGPADALKKFCGSFHRTFPLQPRD